MLNSLKKALKQMLIEKQHKLYNEELSARKLTYDMWIKQQEEGLEIAEIISAQQKKCLKKETGITENETLISKNDGELAKNASAGLYELKFDLRSEKAQPGRIFWLKNEFSIPVIQALAEEENDSLEESILLLSFYEGELSKIALPLIQKKFQENKNLILIYGDEDRLAGEERVEPWFKPDWSPDTFLSYFYFGGLVALSLRQLKKAYDNPDMQVRQAMTDGRELLYRLLFEMIKAGGGFEAGHTEEKLPVAHLPYVLFHSKENGYEQIKNLHLPEDVLQGTAPESRDGNSGQMLPELSVIIPSKDNPEILFRCIDSMLTRTQTGCRYEILVIDNGSNEENKQIIEEKIRFLQENPDRDVTGIDDGSARGGCGFTGIRYIYQPMVFNFSVMCNQGAEAAKGSILLFLNDDMEIIQPDWLELMVQKVCLPYAGAVGAKLFYPETDIIQHAGITNLRVGPAHKLQYLSDAKTYYFGRNRWVHNMLAVTGACLMVRKEVFEQAGGFATELAVAFNDVDLCYTIHELGYYNVQRNDVVLYHHESLSRGKDGESTEKQLRLQREKDILYERHQDIYGKDPFYHGNLTMDMLESAYSPAFHYQVRLDMPWSEAALCTKQISVAREDKCLVVGMECAMDLYKWQYGVSQEKGKVKPRKEDLGYYFQGYSFVIGADNACYKKKLLLKNKESGQIFGIPMESRYRQDIKNNLKDQINVDLTGYAAKLQKDKLPEGVYQFGMLAEDTCSRQKLVNWSNWVLEVKPDVTMDGGEAKA